MYGGNISGLVPVEGSRRPRLASTWWMDLLKLEGSEGVNWFTYRVRRKVGNGRHTSFWLDRWTGKQPLSKVFPHLLLY